MTSAWKNPRRVFQPLMREIDAKGLAPETLVKQAQSVGADTLLVNGGGFSAWYPSALESQRVNKYVAPDFMGRLIDACHAAGIYYIARMDVSKGYKEWVRAHPDWFVYRQDKSLDSVWDMPQTCFTGPFWQQENFKIVSEMLGQYKIDAFFYNYFHFAPCYCERCKEQFHRWSGEELPAPGIISATYERWRETLFAEYTARLKAFIHEKSPGTLLIPYHHIRDGWDYRSMLAAGDVMSAQASNPLVVNPVNPQPRWNHWGAEEVMLSRSVLPHIAPLVVNSCSEFFASRQTAMPGDRLIRDLIQVAAHGGSTCPAINGTLDQADARAVPAMQATGRYLRDNSRAYEGLTSRANVAVIRSNDSILLGNDHGQPAGNTMRPGHVAEYRGMYELLVRSHYQADIVPARGLTAASLARYDAVVLPAISHLADDDASAIDEYVERGGSVIATGDTGSFDDLGRQRTSPALRSMPVVPVVGRSISGAYGELMGAGLRQAFPGIPHIGLDGEYFAPAGARGETEQDLLLIGPFKNNAPEFTYWEGHGTEPALSSYAMGKGTLTWLPWRTGALYGAHGIPEYVTLLQHLLERRGVRTPISTDAPDVVEIVAYDHPEGVLVHAINEAAPQMGAFTKAPALAGFSITVKCDAKSARRLDTNEEISLLRDGEGVTFRLERLDSFAAVMLLD